MSKHKLDRTGDHATERPSVPTCILHVSSISDHGAFIAFSRVKGTASDKLEYLQNIRNQRLKLAHDSPYRMQSVCDQIPETVPNDLESTGYHRQCYQRFTGNLHLLSDGTGAKTSDSTWHHSPRKLASGASASPLFPPECIFCDKLEIKGSDRKTERPVAFSSWTKRENAWQEIEPRAKKMGMVQLYRRVQNEYLFAVEAKHHPSCFRSFRTAFANYERGAQRAEGSKDTEHVQMSAVHGKALASVLEYIQTHVIQQNETGS